MKYQLFCFINKNYMFLENSNHVYDPWKTQKSGKSLLYLFS